MNADNKMDMLLLFKEIRIFINSWLFFVNPYVASFAYSFEGFRQMFFFHNVICVCLNMNDEEIVKIKTNPPVKRISLHSAHQWG